MWYKIAGVLCGFWSSGIRNPCSCLIEELLCEAQSSNGNSVLNNEDLCILVDNSYWAFEGAPILTLQQVQNGVPRKEVVLSRKKLSWAELECRECENYYRSFGLKEDYYV